MNTSEELQRELDIKFLSSSKFTNEIEKMVIDRDDLNYITAITEYCELHNIDIESIVKLVSPALKERIRGDAIRLNYMIRNSKARLPL